MATLVGVPGPKTVREGLLPCVTMLTAQFTTTGTIAAGATHIVNIADNRVRVGDMVWATLQINTADADWDIGQQRVSVNGNIELTIVNRGTAAATDGTLTAQIQVHRG